MMGTPATQSAAYPPKIGIVAMEVYFPRQFVDQSELEAHDGVSAGKYTIGLGQTKMAFCSDREDINSICLTAVQNLFEKCNVQPEQIGRLEVGTETIIDKAKSVKTVLMQLFDACGNHSVEGIDTTNACYGGTSALFNAINWIESSSWDGRFALVVAGDIAVYRRGSARPTGGAGVVAMLVGPNAPLVFEPGMRATHMEHAWDFFKPDLSSEYPEVDGPMTIQCYYRAIDACYSKFLAKAERADKRSLMMDDLDYFAFHSPYTKLVLKSFARLALNDFMRHPDDPRFAAVQEFRGRRLSDTYGDKDVEKAFIALTREQFAAKVDASLLMARQLGNMYCGSVYASLASLVSQSEAIPLRGKRIVCFSFGSGFAASMFSIRVDSDPTSIARVLAIPERLKARIAASPAEYDRVMDLREKTHNLRSYTPESAIDAETSFFPGTFYLERVDEKFRRHYRRIPL